MSAWRVSAAHIDVLVAGVLANGGYRHRGKWVAVKEEAATELGKMLWRENYKSVNARYGENERIPRGYSYVMPRWAERQPYQCTVHGENGPELQTRYDLVVDAGVLAKQVSCYDYQTCEHAAYYTSRAYSVVLSLSCSLLSKVQGYAAAKWGV